MSDALNAAFAARAIRSAAQRLEFLRALRGRPLPSDLREALAAIALEEEIRRLEVACPTLPQEAEQLPPTGIPFVRRHE